MNKSKETIEDILKDAAENGDTQKLIGLLEKGAPFVVDMVHNYLNYLYFKIQTLFCIYTQSIFIQISLKHKHLILFTYNFILFHLGPVKNKVWYVTKKNQIIFLHP